MAAIEVELEHAIGFSGGLPGALHVASEANYVNVLGSSAVINSFVSAHDQFFLRGHTDAISACRISPSGRLLATGQRGDADVIVWDLRTASPLYRFEEHDGAVTALAFSEDERVLLSAGAEDGLVVAWDLASGTIIARARADPNPTLSLAFGGFVRDVKGRPTCLYQFAAGGVGGTTLWGLNPSEGRMACERVSASGAMTQRDITCCAFSPVAGTPWLYCGAASGDIMIVHVKSRSVYHSVYASGGGITSLATLATGAGTVLLLVGTGDGSVLVYEHSAASAEHDIMIAAASGGATGSAAGAGPSKGAVAAATARSFVLQRSCRVAGAVWSVAPLVGTSTGRPSAHVVASAGDLAFLVGTSAGRIYRVMAAAVSPTGTGGGAAGGGRTASAGVAGAFGGGGGAGGSAPSPSAAGPGGLTTTLLRESHGSAVDPLPSAAAAYVALAGGVMTAGVLSAAAGGSLAAAAIPPSAASTSTGGHGLTSTLSTGAGGMASAAGASGAAGAAATSSSLMTGLPASLVATARIPDVLAVAFPAGSSDRFVTAGTDGCVRVFDSTDFRCLSTAAAGATAGYPTCVDFASDFHVSGWQDGHVRAFLAVPPSAAAATTAGPPFDGGVTTIHSYAAGRGGGGTVGSEAGAVASAGYRRGGAGVTGGTSGGAWGTGGAGSTLVSAPPSAAAAAAAASLAAGSIEGIAAANPPIWVIKDAHSLAEGGVTAVLVSGNQRFVVTAGAGGGIRVWDIRSRALVAQFKEHKAAVTHMRLLPGDTTLLSVSRDRALIQWDLRTERQVTQHVGRVGGMHALAVLRDGSAVVTTGQDRKVTWWDLKQTAPLASTPYPAHPHTKADCEGLCIAAAHSRDLLAVGGTDARVHILDARTGAVLVSAQGHSAPVRDVAFSHDDKQLISTGADGAVMVYNVF